MARRARRTRDLTRIYVHVGTRIAQRRTLLGASLDDLSKTTGIPSDRLSGFEGGMRPSPVELLCVAGALDLAVSDFFD